MNFFKKLGKSVGSLAAPNTIIGKLSRGDKAGAFSSAKNYVKSGEIMTDFRNIATGNVLGMAKKGIGGSVNSLIPSLQQQMKVQQVNTKVENALSQTAQGKPEVFAMGVPLSTYGVGGVGKRSATSSMSSQQETTKKMNYTPILIGVGLLALLKLKR